jgi:gas vesicle protein
MTTKKDTITKKNKISKGKMVAIGAGMAAISAGAYYLLGPDGKKNQKKVSALMNKMEKEAKIKVKKVKDITKPIYDKAIDGVADTYSKQYKMHEKEIKSVAKKLKGEYKAAAKTVKKSIKKVS